MHGPENIHEGPKTSYRVIEDPRHQACDLHGRHDAKGKLKTNNPRAHLQSTISPKEPGMYLQHVTKSPHYHLHNKSIF